MNPNSVIFQSNLESISEFGFIPAIPIVKGVSIFWPCLESNLSFIPLFDAKYTKLGFVILYGIYSNVSEATCSLHGSAIAYIQ